MRIDHFAYQRATRVAAAGLVLQFLMGLGMLIFSLATGEHGDTTFGFGSLFVFCGVLAWLSLIVVFHQHKLERLEALEEDEMAAAREGTSSIFEAADEEIRVAARRLRLMHKWLIPAVSIFLALLLAVFCWQMLLEMRSFGAAGDDALEAADFAVTPALGWAVAISLSLAAISFIFSRFVSGMAQLAAWRNLRGGAGFMVGNSLVSFAIATGITFRFFDPDSAVIQGVAYAIAGLMGFMAAEILLNLVLNFYRPRIPGEVPRPAFDSRVLSIFSAPDTLVRSINEAVNYQFGFDVTSTWGYQLLMRSLVRLFALGGVVLLLLSTVVVVEPYQQAVKLTGGRIAGDQTHGSGPMFKWPWPFQSAEVVDVGRVKSLDLTAIRQRQRFINPGGIEVYVWTDDLEGKTNGTLDPFLVEQSQLEIEGAQQVDMLLDVARSDDEAEQAGIVRSLALADLEIKINYRIKDDGRGLRDYLKFAPDTRGRREALTVRQKILRALALREASLILARHSLDEVLSLDRSVLSGELRAAIQKAFDDRRTGVEVIAVNIPLVRPSGGAASDFEDLMMARQDMEKAIANAMRARATNMTNLLGDPDLLDEAIAAIDGYIEFRDGKEADDPAVLARRQQIEQLIRDAGGSAGLIIDIAESERWIKLMATMAQSNRVRGELAAYREAPELYRQRETMRVMRQVADNRKYILGIDPSRVRVDVEFKDLDLQQQFFQPDEATEGGTEGGS